MNATNPAPHGRGTPDPAPQDVPVATRTPDPRVRSGTVVAGLVLLLLGTAVTAVGLGVRLDLQAVLIGLLLVAGTALLVGAALSARRGRG